MSTCFASTKLNIFFLWQCLDNIQDSIAMTIIFPPEFTQLPRYQDWKRDKHIIKLTLEGDYK